LAFAVERDRLRAQIKETKRAMWVSREAAELSVISNSSSTKPIAGVAGEKPLREISYDNFQTVVARYLDVVLMVADEKQYKKTIDSRAPLKKIAEMLFKWRCARAMSWICMSPLLKKRTKQRFSVFCYSG
jgi:hypothetical protein